MALYYRTKKFWEKVRDHVQAKIEIQGNNQRTRGALAYFVDHSEWQFHLFCAAPESRDLNSAEVATVIVRNWFGR